MYMHTFTVRLPSEESGPLTTVEVWAPLELSKALNLRWLALEQVTLLWPKLSMQWSPPCLLPSLTFAKFSLLHSELAARWPDTRKPVTCWCPSGILRWNPASEKLAPAPYHLRILPIPTEIRA